MSHITTIKAKVTHLSIMEKALQALKIAYVKGTQQVELYSGSTDANLTFTLPGWRYPVAVQTTTGEVKYDNYNGSWGEQVLLDKVLQEYSLQIAENQLQDLTLEGWSLERQTQPNGDIQVIATK